MGADVVTPGSDPDVVEVGNGDSRPVHVKKRYLTLVALGGTVGTALREALSLSIPALDGIPIGIFVINIVGALALGLLLESLVRVGPDLGRIRTVRLLVGTGVLGGFTTYSALATDAALLIIGGNADAGVLYALATVVVGAGTTWLGIAAAAFFHNRSATPTSSGGAR